MLFFIYDELVFFLFLFYLNIWFFFYIGVRDLDLFFWFICGEEIKRNYLRK